MKRITTLIWSMMIFGGLYGQEGYERSAWIGKSEALKPVLTETIVHPVAIVDIVPDESAFQGWKAVEVAPMDSLYMRSFRDVREVVVDLGDHYTGYVSFDCEFIWGTSDGPTRFKITCGEVPAELVVPFDPYPGVLSRAWLQDEVFTTMELVTRQTLERRVAGRYIKFELEGTSQFFNFRISNIEFRAVTSAMAEPEPLGPSASKLINEIDRIGLKTLAECMQTVYEDGPKRDRRLWVGDLYLEAKANTFSFKNHDLTKRCLYLLAGLSDNDGYILGTVFEDPEPRPQPGQLLLDYSLLYNAVLKDYLMATGDRETAIDLWPVAKQQLSIIEDLLQENGIVDFEKASDEWWVFVDWKDALHRHVATQGIMIFALKETLALAKELNTEGEISQVPAMIERMTSAAMREMYNVNTNLFESGPDKQVSYASQTWMVLAGVVDKEKGAKALQAIMKRDDAIFPGGPYMYSYFIQALLDTGLDALAKEQLTTYWGGMIEKGADTFWEVYDPEDDLLSPYGFFPINSYCHAWSCTPVYFIRKYSGVFQ